MGLEYNLDWAPIQSHPSLDGLNRTKPHMDHPGLESFPDHTCNYVWLAHMVLFFRLFPVIFLKSGPGTHPRRNDVEHFHAKARGRVTRAACEVMMAVR
jgi:hypothetical protein